MSEMCLRNILMAPKATTQKKQRKHGYKNGYKQICFPIIFHYSKVGWFCIFKFHLSLPNNFNDQIDRYFSWLEKFYYKESTFKVFKHEVYQ